MQPRFLSIFLFLGLGSSCAVPAMDAVRDLAAIHQVKDWQPQSPAVLTTAPAFYLGDLTAAAKGPESYSIQDHRRLEKAILERIASVDVHDPARSIEVSSWILIELTQDDSPEARILAAKILARNAGLWILNENARILLVDEGVDLPTALVRLDRASDRAEFDQALRAISRAKLPDTITGIRILTALGRKANAFGFSSGAGNSVVFSTALGIVLYALEEASHDSNAAVAATCLHWVDLLQPRAQIDAAVVPSH